MARSKQLQLLEKQALSYGGELMKTRRGRKGPRPLATRQTLHLVLRSSKAKGDWSFRSPENQSKINAIVKRFCKKYHITLLSFANVGHHLHFHVKLFRLHEYKPFIRALTSALMMAVTGVNRWTKPEDQEKKVKFWDYRPFTRVVQSFRAYLNLRDYIQLNRGEGFGAPRSCARELVRQGIWVSSA